MGGLFICEHLFLIQTGTRKIKTIVYVDGFNLYYGCLQGTPYRWLDVFSLAKRIAKENNPKNDIILLKYFTADIKTKLSPRGQDSWNAQQDYLLALKNHNQSKIDIIKGSYLIDKAKYHAYKDPVDFDEKHEVWRAEEKQTDVNIAVHMLCDSMEGICQQVIIFSNDSDLAPALKAIKDRFCNIKIGTVAPISANRQASAELNKYSDWSRSHILPSELSGSQLPESVMTRKRKVQKPSHWNAE